MKIITTLVAATVSLFPLGTGIAKAVLRRLGVEPVSSGYPWVREELVKMKHTLAKLVVAGMVALAPLPVAWRLLQLSMPALAPLLRKHLCRRCGQHYLASSLEPPIHDLCSWAGLLQTTW